MKLGADWPLHFPPILSIIPVAQLWVDSRDHFQFPCGVQDGVPVSKIFDNMAFWKLILHVTVDLRGLQW